MFSLLIEIALFTALGFIYYFYQKRKILKYEETKGPMIMGHVLQACLTERGEQGSSEMDGLIEAIDDYLHNRSTTPPTALMERFSSSGQCSDEFRAVLEEALKELE